MDNYIYKAIELKKLRKEIEKKIEKKSNRSLFYRIKKMITFKK